MKKSKSIQEHRYDAEQLAHAIAEKEQSKAEPGEARFFQTGPKTPKGKEISSQNARKHGLCSAMLILPGEDGDQYVILSSGLDAEYAPATMTERLLVNEIAENMWRLRRVRGHQDQALYNGCPYNDDYINKLNRYATGYDRAFHRAVKTLRDIQRERKQQEPAQPPKTNQVDFVSQNAETAETLEKTNAANGSATRSNAATTATNANNSPSAQLAVAEMTASSNTFVPQTRKTNHS